MAIYAHGLNNPVLYFKEASLNGWDCGGRMIDNERLTWEQSSWVGAIMMAAGALGWANLDLCSTSCFRKCSKMGIR